MLSVEICWTVDNEVNEKQFLTRCSVQHPRRPCPHSVSDVKRDDSASWPALAPNTSLHYRWNHYLKVYFIIILLLLLLLITILLLFIIVIIINIITIIIIITCIYCVLFSFVMFRRIRMNQKREASFTWGTLITCLQLLFN